MAHRRHARNRSLMALVGLAMAASIFLGGCSAVRAGTPAPNFELTDQRGQVVSLDRLRGRPILITFLFTHCPDTCPLYLSRVQQALAALEVADAEISVVAVTVDPERDTVERLQRYAGSWPSSWYFLTGRPTAVARVLSDYEVSAWSEVFGGLDHSPSGYDVIHTAKMMVLDENGNIATALYGNWSAEQLEDVVGKVLAGEVVAQGTAVLHPFARLLQSCGEFASSHPWTFSGLIILIMFPGLILPVFLLRTFLATGEKQQQPKTDVDRQRK